MTISPDNMVFWQWGWFSLNATIVFTWLVMALLTTISWLVTRRLSAGTSISYWQNLLEVLVTGIRDQISEVSQQQPGRFLPFVGSLFLFIAMANLLNIVPGLCRPPVRCRPPRPWQCVCLLRYRFLGLLRKVWPVTCGIMSSRPGLCSPLT